MSSEVSQCNLGIAALGEKAFIQSLDENSVAAKYCKLFYDPARRSALRAHGWNFAKGRVDLALLGDGPSPWAYQYALPSNCLRARYINPAYPGEKVPFEIALDSSGSVKVINTDRETATLIYTVDVTNPNIFDPLFVDVMAASLAWRLAPVLAPNKLADMERRFIASVRAAQAADAGEGYEEHERAPDWLEARLGGSDLATILASDV